MLSNLDSDSASGPDGISPHVPKTCSSTLAHPLSLFYSPSHLLEVICHLLGNQQTSLPCIKRCKTDPCNCRPISLLPIISKVMESIIASDIKSFLFSNGLISGHQLGFRPGYSSLDMLILLSQQWMEELYAGHEIRAISRDISRAFDMVWHPALLTKHSSYGIQGHLHSWFADFFSCRSQRVALNGVFIPSSCPGWSSSR